MPDRQPHHLDPRGDRRPHRPEPHRRRVHPRQVHREERALPRQDHPRARNLISWPPTPLPSRPCGTVLSHATSTRSVSRSAPCPLPVVLGADCPRACRAPAARAAPGRGADTRAARHGLRLEPLQSVPHRECQAPAVLPRHRRVVPGLRRRRPSPRLCRPLPGHRDHVPGMAETRAPDCARSRPATGNCSNPPASSGSTPPPSFPTSPRPRTTPAPSSPATPGYSSFPTTPRTPPPARPEARPSTAPAGASYASSRKASRATNPAAPTTYGTAFEQLRKHGGPRLPGPRPDRHRHRNTAHPSTNPQHGRSATPRTYGELPGRRHTPGLLGCSSPRSRCRTERLTRRPNEGSRSGGLPSPRSRRSPSSTCRLPIWTGLAPQARRQPARPGRHRWLWSDRLDVPVVRAGVLRAGAESRL